jgi:hypothetical protein
MRRAAVLVLLATMLSSVAACRSTKTEKTAVAGTQPVSTAAVPSAFTGTVAETMDAGGYTYARLQGGKEDVWIAATQFQTKVGDQLTVTLDMPVQNFESKTLQRTFPLVYFVSRVARGGQPVDGSGSAAAAVPALMASHGSAPVQTTVEPIAAPAGGIAIADVWAKRTALAGQTITVRGKVVKVNEQILGRNWIHLQDGSGSAGDRTNDLTITTDDVVGLGDVVTIKGVLAIDKDFGAGYAYGAMVEGAKVVK